MDCIPAADRHGRSATVRVAALRLITLAALACLASWFVVESTAQARHRRDRRPCPATAAAMFEACEFDVKDDAATADAICINVVDPEEQAECFDDARAEEGEAGRECRDQREARLELCGALGPAPYDPGFDPADFDTDFGNPTQANPWFPLGIGNSWEYVGGDETITVEVLDETKQIEGITCIVVNDVVAEDGEVIEDTDDWYGLRTDGTVGYFGEIALNFETFDGDVPDDPELVDIEGSFKAGREGAKAGTRFPGAPAVGQVYREEWAVGDAEDAAEIVSTTYGWGGGAGEFDAFVPQALAELLCDGDCVVTRNFSPLEPDVLELKYYTPGIGTFLEVEPESGDVVRLVNCSVDADPRCAAVAALPLP
jgi:hypothetical protein